MSDTPITANAATTSRLHIGSEAINTVLERLVNDRTDFEARYDGGQVIVQAMGLTIVVESLELRPDGVELTLRFS